MTKRQSKSRERALIGLCVALSCMLGGAGAAVAQGGFFEDLFGGGPRWRPWRQAPPSRHAPPAAERRAPNPKPKVGGAAQQKQQGKPAGAPGAAPVAVPEGPPPPYEPQLLRLSEILGALSYLRDLCGAKDGEEWRATMASLLDAEAKTGSRRQKLVGAFNHGFRGYEITYRACTPNAELAISRYLEEGGRLARDISYRFGSS